VTSARSKWHTWPAGAQGRSALDDPLPPVEVSVAMTALQRLLTLVSGGRIHA